MAGVELAVSSDRVDKEDVVVPAAIEDPESGEEVVLSATTVVNVVPSPRVVDVAAAGGGVVSVVVAIEGSVESIDGPEGPATVEPSS